MGKRDVDRGKSLETKGGVEILGQWSARWPPPRGYCSPTKDQRERVIRPMSGMDAWPGQSQCSPQTQRDQVAARVAKRMGNVQSNSWLREWLSTSGPMPGSKRHTETKLTAKTFCYAPSSTLK